MKQAPFIAIEGPIGVGKSALAKAISEQFGYHLLNEIVDENPFLHKFYGDISEWSFQTEMFFLCNRYKQLEDTKKNYFQHDQPVVADYHIFKNLIFARRTLNEEQYAKYEQIYHILTNDQINPNLIIYLTADLETLLYRIKKRGRPFELDIDPNYMMQISTDYEKFMNEYEFNNPDVPILRFNGDQIDFVEKVEDLHFILSKIQETVPV